MEQKGFAEVGVMTVAVKLEDQVKRCFPKSCPESLQKELRTWVELESSSSQSLKSLFSAAPVEAWAALVEQSNPANHSWYDYLAREGSLLHLASFLEEEAQMPAFVPLLEELRIKIPIASAQDNLERNIFDETHPERHSVLFERCLESARQRVSPLPIFDEALAATNLVYYYGHFCDSDFGIGALFATEAMVPRRAALVKQSLLRLGFTEAESRFFTIHSTVDVEHAKEWLDEIIIPYCIAHPNVKENIALGIAVRLQTSQKYLNRLLLQTFTANELPSLEPSL